MTAWDQLKAACLAVLLVPGPVPASAEGPAGAKPRLTVQKGHTAPLNCVAVSPDGKYLATGSWDHTAKLWDLSTGQEITTLTGHTDEVLAVAFSPDGRYLATGGQDGKAKLWDLATGREARGIGTSSWVTSLAFTPDGRYLVTGALLGPARLWELATGQEVRSFRPDIGSTVAVAISPDGKRLATGLNGPTADLWDLSTGAHIRTLKGHKGDIETVAFSPDGGRVATGSHDDTAKLWDASTGKLLRTFKGHTSIVRSVAFSPDGRLLATGSSDSTAKLWDPATGRELKTLKGHRDIVPSVAFTPDGRLLATAGGDRTAKLWDLTTGRDVLTFKGSAGALSSLALSPDGKHLATDGSGATARLWDLSTGRQTRTFKGHEASVLTVAFSPDGKQLATGSYDTTARLWDLATGRELRAFRGHANRLVSLAFSPDGQYLATYADDILEGPKLGRDGTVRVWETATGRQVQMLEESQGVGGSLTFSPDGRLLAMIGTRKVLLWDWEKKELVRTLSYTSSIGGGIWVNSIAFSPDGKSIAMGIQGQTDIWDLSTGQPARSFQGHASYVSAVAFSPDGRRLVTAGGDGAVKAWDPASGRELGAFTGHTGIVSVAAFGPGGKYLATGSMDGTVKLWDPATGKELCSLISLDDGWVAVTPEGYFDGSPERTRSIIWTVGLQSYPLEAFSEGYYEPGLVGRLLAGEAVGAKGQPRLSEGFETPPSAEIVSPKDGAQVEGEAVEVQVDAVDQGGGIDEIRLYHNGKAVGGETRGLKVAAGARRTVSFQVRLADGENRLRAVALSRTRIEGKPHELTVLYRGPAKRSSLHVLAVGISGYKNPGLDLDYAKPDAEAVAGFFDTAPKGLFAEVRARTLLDGQATKTAILEGLGALRETPPQDVAVVYLAGHGESLGDSWYFIPYELVYPEREEELKAKGLSSEELRSAVQAIGARKVLLLMDSCRSGGALLAFAARGFEERKVLSLLARSTGVHVVAASTKEQLASEVKELGHGVFTYTALEALKGAADANPKDGVVTVRELLGYVEARLPELSEKYKAQAQYPVIDSRGMDFPLAPAQ